MTATREPYPTVGTHGGGVSGPGRHARHNATDGRRRKKRRRPYQASRTVTPGTDDRKERYLAPFAFIELLKIFGSLCQRLNCLCAAGLESRLPAHSFSITVARCRLPSPLPTAPSSTSLSPSLSQSLSFVYFPSLLSPSPPLPPPQSASEPE